MPIHKIEVSEYECAHCGYKWINRVNGKDGPIPHYCAKCKRLYWNGIDESYRPITPRERSLRMQLYRYEGEKKGRGRGGGGIYRGSTSYLPNELCKEFLSCEPRPTIQELKTALSPFGLSHKPRWRGYIPGKNPHVWTRNQKEYDRLQGEEPEKRREFMRQVIELRKSKQSEVEKTTVKV